MGNHKNFAAILNDALKESGMTAAELSRKAKVSPSSISDYRKGYQTPKEATWERIEEALGLKTDDGEGGTELEKKTPKSSGYTMTTEQAARTLGVSEMVVKNALKQKLWPSCVGFAVEFESSHRYIILKNNFIKWINGEIW